MCNCKKDEPTKPLVAGYLMPKITFAVGKVYELRDGAKARCVATDAKCPRGFSILMLTRNKGDDTERAAFYNSDGVSMSAIPRDVVHEHVPLIEGWVNVWPNGDTGSVHPTEKKAREYYIAGVSMKTIKVREVRE